MRRKKMGSTVLCLLTAILLLQGCGSTKTEYSVAEKAYTYTGEPFAGLEGYPFTITIHEDGSFVYYESLLSSYMGIGEWTVEDDILTLSDDEEIALPRMNRFRIDGEDLVFLEEDSSNFIYIKVKDGERFTGATLPA